MLRTARNRLGIGLREAGRRTGVSYAHLGNIERATRRPSRTVAHAIADVYRLDADQRAELLLYSTDLHGRDYPR